MSKLTQTIITMSNLVSAGPGDWKELHDMALELQAKLELAQEAVLEFERFNRDVPSDSLEVTWTHMMALAKALENRP